ncbi:hypothetical protein Jab_1c00410 [Janthinobacterium sp. HH01]|uniref:putative type VI secretion system effector n=1 Tax=Janthinobacterium sp. HH01 TaxID=1198452 RepID=UPI0002AE9688|nr:putative type VI secretion system effector [Janthinobacterium sp. HH01]ELX11458.1 hypothetical protein Jab_1c00410 [Janthinobacterium sp. HH01]
MEKFFAHPSASGLLKISGVISNYHVSRASASFVFTESDQTKLGVVAVAAALAGMGGQAMSVASNTSATEEDADYVEFNLGEKAIKGWLWRSPFHDGDHVEVAVEWQTDHYELFGLARSIDQTIALYPHCSRSKRRHIRNSLKWWLIVTAGMQIIISVGLLTISWNTFIEIWRYMLFEGAWWLPVGLTAALAIAVASITRQWMPFVTLAERVFQTLELPDARNIDLVQSSKNRRTDLDTPEFGAMYFRY